MLGFYEDIRQRIFVAECQLTQTVRMEPWWKFEETLNIWGVSKGPSDVKAVFRVACCADYLPDTSIIWYLVSICVRRCVESHNFRSPSLHQYSSKASPDKCPHMNLARDVLHSHFLISIIQYHFLLTQYKRMCMYATYGILDEARQLHR